tara:strand:- start:65 stop:202 length:138 start_codon:yes stop_codon:yes gene_type:complete
MKPCLTHLKRRVEPNATLIWPPCLADLNNPPPYTCGIRRLEINTV